MTFRDYLVGFFNTVLIIAAVASIVALALPGCQSYQPMGEEVWRAL